MKNTRLPAHLQEAQAEIEGYAREYGLDFFPTIYEVLDYRTLYEAAALGGFPTRYPHWRFGMEYDQLMKGHIWLGSTIYEMVINNNPSYAYLLEGNETVTQKMVMAHVTAHVDFFKNNMWFAHTNRKMLDEMANHATRVQQIIDREGYDPVESFIDTCLSLDNLIDYHAPYIRRPEAQIEEPIVQPEEQSEDTTVEGLKVEREYMRDYINPPDFLAQQRARLDQERQQRRKFPANSQKDVLLFLLNYAPLERWQHTLLSIIRDEAYYFAPQGMTKIINEGWACLVAGSLLATDRGLLPVEAIVRDRLPVQVSDGTTLQPVYDWVAFAERETVWLRTRRGLELEGSTSHRVLLPDGSWRRLDALQMGDRLHLCQGPDLWAREYVPIDWLPARRMTLQDGADQAGVHRSTVLRYRGASHATESSAVVAPLVAEYDAALATGSPQRPQPTPRIPAVVDEALASLLGYLVGDGHISTVKHTIGLTTGDAEEADRFATLVEHLFGLPVQRCCDCNRWHLSFSSKDVASLLVHLGLAPGTSPHEKDVPGVILRSPRSVVAAFLRARYDADGSAGEAGIILSTASAAMGRTVQLLLLNFGILALRRPQADGCWHIHVTGQSARRFQAAIGFGLGRKQEALQRSLTGGQGVQQEDWSDTVVALERRRAPVYDISVATTHRYAAQGFVNHNSYWHSQIMTRRAVLPSEIISFADLHSGVVATSGGRLNPYKVGLELLRDIEERWDKGRFGKAYAECDDIAEKRNWDRQTGLGRQKLFEVRRLYNDVNFIDEFLTPEFVFEQKLFSFRYNRDTDLYEIASREFQEIKEKLLFRLTNFGQPYITVEDANYNNRGELYLRHRHEGIDLQPNYARDTLRNLHKIWTRPVYIETVVDERKRLISFDGSDFSERRMD